MVPVGAQKEDLYDNAASKVRYEAYSRLQAAAVAFGENLPIPEIVAIGGQSDGKSSLLEAFLGFRFNLTSSEMGTRRPLIVQMVHDPAALEPRCRLQEEDSEEYGPVINPESSIADAIRERTETHLRRLGTTVSSKPIVMRAEYAYCPNLTIIDTPGFILKARKGETDSTPDDILSMVKAQCAPAHRLILFLQQSSVEWCSSLWMHVIQDVDPHYQRTIMVASKFDNRLKEFGERWEVDKYLSATGYLPPNVKPFFVALPKDRNASTSAEWRRQIQEVDAGIKRHLRDNINGGFDEERFGSRIGFGNLRRFLEEELARRYKDAAPATLAILQQRCEAVAKELILADQKVQEAGDVVSLRSAAMQYVLSITAEVEKILLGSAATDPTQYGMTTEEEKAACTSANWPGVASAVHPTNAGLRLFGGAAVERCLAEFLEAAKCIEFPPFSRDKVANMLLAYKARNGGGAGKVAEELARAAARQALGPLLDTAVARLGAVVRRAYDIAADQAQLQRTKHVDQVRPHVAFHAALRSAFQTFVAGLEERCKTLVHHHLDTATSEFAMGLLGSSGEEADKAVSCDDFENVVPSHAAAPAAEPMAEDGMERPPFMETQATVPETPSPDVLTVSKPDVPLGRRMHLAAAGRNVDADSPAKGRVSKAPRTGIMAPPPAGGSKNAYLAVCSQAERLFGRIRQAVAGQAVPATLKSAFLEPVGARLPTELCVEMFGRTDTDFMAMFTAAGVLAALEAKRDALAKRTEGLIRCKQEFAELARCL